MTRAEANRAERGVLAGVRVVEIGRRIAAPLVGMLLAERGAEVVRVVDTQGPASDPVLDAMLARGKEEAHLDLSSESGRALLLELVSQADVVIENLAEGELAALGVDPDRLRTGTNSRLVSCRVAPFPRLDPRSDGPDHEALSGAAGYLYDRPIGAPRYHDFPIGSVMAGLFGASAVVAALIARERTGYGQHVDTSLQGANYFAQILQVLMKTGVPRGFLALKMVATPFMGTWECGDGRWVYLHITLPAHNALILEKLEEHGHGDEVRELRSVLSEQTMRDPSQVGSIEEAKQIRVIYRRIFKARPAAEWERLFGRELCCIVVRDIEEWMDAAAEAGMPDSCRVDDPVFGDLRCPGPGITDADRPAALAARVFLDDPAHDVARRWSAEARADGGTDEVGAPTGELGAPLAGTRVLDMARIIAGPCAARILAELGADVLSVQTSGGLDWALSFHLAFNAGKRSVSLDFRDDEGKRKLRALMDDYAPHAFLQNYRNLDIAKAAQLDPETLRGRYPHLVYTHLNAYGNSGEWRDRPGFEQVVQAVSGIQLGYGTGGRPKLLPTPVIDIGSGLLGAFAALLGLYHQRQTGEGMFGATHLTRVAVLLQVEQVAAAQRERCMAAADERGETVDYDPDARVVGGVARALDAFVCVAGPRRDLARWLQQVGLLQPGTSFETLGDVLAKRMWRRPVAYWRHTLRKAGVEGSVLIEPLRSVKRVVDDVAALDASPMRQILKRSYPGCSMDLTFIRCPMRFSLTPMVDVAPPPLRGADTHDVLARIGVDVPPGAGELPYPPDKPLVEWLMSLAQWGWFAWRSGII